VLVLHCVCAAAVIIFGATGNVGLQMLDFIVKQNVMGDDVKVSASNRLSRKCLEGGAEVVRTLAAEEGRSRSETEAGSPNSGGLKR
jgi:aspartate-semialdehyde dehydrogenase